MVSSPRLRGGAPCHVSVNRTGEYAIVANYVGGSSAMFSLKKDGSLDKRVDFRQHEGKGVNPKRQWIYERFGSCWKIARAGPYSLWRHGGWRRV